MRFLITGGLGFIGSNFIRHILSAHGNARVVNLDNMSIGSNPASLNDVKKDKRYKFVKGDIVDPKLVSRLMRDVDVVVNFAAETHVDRSISNPEPFFKSNTIGTFNLLEQVRRSDGVKFVHISTDEVYGEIAKGSFKESDSTNPSSPYSASKTAADTLVLTYCRTYGLDALVTRCTNNFGPYQHPEKFIPKTIIRAMLNLSAPIYGTGKNIRDWIYVLDNCEAVDLLISKGKLGEIYNISAGNELENLEVAKRILRAIGKSENLITFVKDRPRHDFRYSLDSTKIGKLGWKPHHSFQAALEQTIEWYTQNKWWWKPIATKKVLHPTPWELRW
jgi:dTDP-glucose 4,6-dehydratase